MRHDWIFDVLKDLKSYAQANGLPALAAKADEALQVARAEIVVIGPLDSSDEGNTGNSTPAGRGH